METPYFVQILTHRYFLVCCVCVLSNTYIYNMSGVSYRCLSQGFDLCRETNSFLLFIRDYFLFHLEYLGLFLICLGPVLVNCGGITNNDALAAHLHDSREDVKGFLCGFESVVPTSSNVCVLILGVQYQFCTIFEAHTKVLSEYRKRKQHEPQAMPGGEFVDLREEM